MLNSWQLTLETLLLLWHMQLGRVNWLILLIKNSWLTYSKLFRPSTAAKERRVMKKKNLKTYRFNLQPHSQKLLNRSIRSNPKCFHSKKLNNNSLSRSLRLQNSKSLSLPLVAWTLNNPFRPKSRQMWGSHQSSKWCRNSWRRIKSILSQVMLWWTKWERWCRPSVRSI